MGFLGSPLDDHDPSMFNWGFIGSPYLCLLEFLDCEVVYWSNQWAWGNPSEQTDGQGDVI